MKTNNTKMLPAMVLGVFAIIFMCCMLIVMLGASTTPPKPTPPTALQPTATTTKNDETCAIEVTLNGYEHLPVYFIVTGESAELYCQYIIKDMRSKTSEFVYKLEQSYTNKYPVYCEQVISETITVKIASPSQEFGQASCEGFMEDDPTSDQFQTGSS